MVFFTPPSCHSAPDPITVIYIMCNAPDGLRLTRGNDPQPQRMCFLSPPTHVTHFSVKGGSQELQEVSWDTWVFTLAPLPSAWGPGRPPSKHHPHLKDHTQMLHHQISLDPLSLSFAQAFGPGGSVNTVRMWLLVSEVVFLARGTWSPCCEMNSSINN